MALKLSDDVINQIKDFTEYKIGYDYPFYDHLTQEQKSLIDEFIQKFQLNATCWEEVLEWIPYEKFSDIEYLAKGGFGTVHKAKWIDGYIWCWNINQTKWHRSNNKYIVLKCLNDSQNLTADFLQEVCCLYLLFIIFINVF